MTTLGHDFFDIAIRGTGAIIANSGSYGSGITVLKTEETNINADFSEQAATIKEYTFKDTISTLYGYQSEANPLENLGMSASKVYLIKVQYKTTDDPAYFKVIFSMTMGQTQSFNMTVVPGLEASEDSDKIELKPAVNGIGANYGWIYFKLVGEGGPRALNTGSALVEGAPSIPKITDWDILCTRTDELQTEDGTTVSTQMPVAGRSSILINVVKEGMAGAISKEINAVTGTTTVKMRSCVDAIGYQWYSMEGMPPTFSHVEDTTYVVKTAEGNFAKFQPLTFYGPNNESFVMRFKYKYEVQATE
jgi:hypothetical protein